MPKSDWDTDYVLPGNKRLRLALFWVTNYGKHNADDVIDKAETMLGKHGIRLDIYPSRKQTKEFTIEYDEKIQAKNSHYNWVRGEAAKIFDDQKTASKKQRLPVFLCDFVYPGFGLTIKSTPWPYFCFVRPFPSSDKITLIHEIGHAAGISGHLAERKKKHKNFMDETPKRSVMYKAQIQKISRAYFMK